MTPFSSSSTISLPPAPPVLALPPQPPSIRPLSPHSLRQSTGENAARLVLPSMANPVQQRNDRARLRRARADVMAALAQPVRARGARARAAPPAARQPGAGQRRGRADQGRQPPARPPAARNRNRLRVRIIPDVPLATRLREAGLRTVEQDTDEFRSTSRILADQGKLLSDYNYYLGYQASADDVWRAVEANGMVLVPAYVTPPKQDFHAIVDAQPVDPDAPESVHSGWFSRTVNAVLLKMGQSAEPLRLSHEQRLEPAILFGLAEKNLDNLVPDYMSGFLLIRPEDRDPIRRALESSRSPIFIGLTEGVSNLQATFFTMEIKAMSGSLTRALEQMSHGMICSLVLWKGLVAAAADLGLLPADWNEGVEWEDQVVFGCIPIGLQWQFHSCILVSDEAGVPIFIRGKIMEYDTGTKESHCNAARLLHRIFTVALKRMTRVKILLAALAQHGRQLEAAQAVLQDGIDSPASSTCTTSPTSSTSFFNLTLNLETPTEPPPNRLIHPFRLDNQSLLDAWATPALLLPTAIHVSPDAVEWIDESALMLENLYGRDFMSKRVALQE